MCETTPQLLDNQLLSGTIRVACAPPAKGVVFFPSDVTRAFCHELAFAALLECRHSLLHSLFTLILLVLLLLLLVLVLVLLVLLLLVVLNLQQLLRFLSQTFAVLNHSISSFFNELGSRPNHNLPRLFKLIRISAHFLSKDSFQPLTAFRIIKQHTNWHTQKHHK
jgi:hypothetical protein